MAGGCGKDGWENTAFRVGKKWDAAELAAQVGLTDLQFVYPGEPRRPIQQQKEKQRRRSGSGWRCNRGFYDTALDRCRHEYAEGWRYTSMCALSVIAWKCGVSKEELEEDLLGLLPVFNKGADRPVKPREIYSAMKMYNEKAMLTQRARLEDWQGWKYEGAKRNGRKRPEHLKRARAVQAIDYPDGEWRNSEGRPTSAAAVRAWRESHPDGSKAECHRETGLDPKTIRKWWSADLNHGDALTSSEVDLKEKTQ